MPLMGSEDVQSMLKFACTLCSGALLRRLWLRLGMGRCSPPAFFGCHASRASTDPSTHGDPVRPSFS